MCIYKKTGLFHILTGKQVKAIVVVHVFGNMADMEQLVAIAEEYNLKIIEDATEALGTYDESAELNTLKSYLNEKVGAGEQFLVLAQLLLEPSVVLFCLLCRCQLPAGAVASGMRWCGWCSFR